MTVTSLPTLNGEHHALICTLGPLAYIKGSNCNCKDNCNCRVAITIAPDNNL